MKIKHFAGYGTIEAKKVSVNKVGTGKILIARVTGNHEQGLCPHYVDNRLIENWLVKKLDKDMGLNTVYKYDAFYDSDYASDIDGMTYVIYYA